MADRNRVTERPLLPNEFWVVSAEWKGGHDKRKIQLENIHFSEKVAKKDWDHIGQDGPQRYIDFKRHPLRKFTSKKVQE